jgi:DNA polymerase-3 subunit alpha
LGLIILPPNINTSFYQFTVCASNDEILNSSLLYGLGAIKGVGEAAIESILNARKQDGPFNNLFEFCRRVDTRKINRRTLEALIKAGAMDNLGTHRASLLASIDTALQIANRTNRDQSSGQFDLFAQVEIPLTTADQYIQQEVWSDEERLQAEKETLGFYLSGHPIDRYRAELAFLAPIRINELILQANRKIKFAGLIVALRTMQTKRGNRIAFATLDDGGGRLEIAFFAESYATYRPLLVKDQLLIIEAEVTIDKHSDNYRLSATEVWTMDQIRGQFAKNLLIKLDAQQLKDNTISQLQNILKEHPKGLCAVTIQYQHQSALANLNLGAEWQIQFNEKLLQHLQSFVGQEAIRVIY